jgi:hypothetical protein
MSVAELSVMIPIIGMTIPIVAITASHKRKMAELRIREIEAQAARGTANTDRRNDGLEERVRVLERIVTDKGHDLAGQIEALRGVEAKIETTAIASSGASSRERVQ